MGGVALEVMVSDAPDGIDSRVGTHGKSRGNVRQLIPSESARDGIVGFTESRVIAIGP
jgi:hypothetical protein